MRCVAAISNSRQRPLFLRRAALASFAWIGALGLLTGSVAHAAEGITAKDIFVSGTEGSHTYRIPAMIVTNKGTLLAFA
ncbi:MAG: glycoside hydrolase, partial [Planctomycetes bacterium]|nr:glycoside hydrolase [Planctomycetota bacterium]